MSDITTLALPKVINDAMAAIQDPETPIEDAAAMYGLLSAIVRRIQKAQGIYVRGKPTAKTRLQEHLSQMGRDAELGPLYLGWEAFDVSWPCNDPDNWADSTVQEHMALVAKVAPEYVTHVPDHLEINSAALGSAVHMGDPVALQLWRECQARGWRKEGGKRAVLKVREVTQPKGKAA